MTADSDGLITVFTPFASFLAMFLFYIIWKIHFFSTISSQEEDMKDIKPEKFCL